MKGSIRQRWRAPEKPGLIVARPSWRPRICHKENGGPISQPAVLGSPGVVALGLAVALVVYVVAARAVVAPQVHQLTPLVEKRRAEVGALDLGANLVR